MTGTDTKKIFDLRIRSAKPLVSPNKLKDELPLQDNHYATIVASRQAIRDIIHKKDRRLLGIVGPCSIHDKALAIEYAHRLKSLRERVQDTIYLIMRVYFEKPRTALGWRGLITDPHLDGSYDIAEGLKIARQILLEIIGMGVAAGSEMLDPIVPQYVDDLISWAAIGARTTESQTHREMASGLSMPVGFKNGTDGSYDSAINALRSSGSPHSFIGIDQHGKTCILNTTGNMDTHIISRGSNQAPNYSPVQLAKVQRRIEELGINPAILVDCSHGNSGKDCTMQEWVLRSAVDQKKGSNDGLIGFMLESSLLPGNQTIPEDTSQLEYGVSVTDPCVGWEDTERMILDAHKSLLAGRDG